MACALNPSFGTYALPEAREKLRLKAGRFGDSRLGRAMISFNRQQALKDLNEPFDVTIADHVKARLYPSQNRCEKRAVAGVQIWDAYERAALKEAVNNCPDDVFVFLDIGANIGLYALFVSSYCKMAGQASHILAIEPSTVMAARLQDNIAASEANVNIIRTAISDQCGTGHLGGGNMNKGETRLLDSDITMGHNTMGERVKIDTLANLVKAQGLTKIHAMKLDIEGQDYQALQNFFQNAPQSSFPDCLILEVGKVSHSPLIDLCLAEGYRLSGRYGLNAIMNLEKIESESTHV